VTKVQKKFSLNPSLTNPSSSKSTVSVSGVRKYAAPKKIIQQNSTANSNALRERNDSMKIGSRRGIFSHAQNSNAFKQQGNRLRIDTSVSKENVNTSNNGHSSALSSKTKTIFGNTMVKKTALTI
jgi:hypothetical protein